MTLSPENCTGWAPGLGLPDGECVWCGVHRSGHPKALQSRASGKPIVPGTIDHRFADSPLASRPEMISPASSAAKIRPDVVFCRACNQGMVIQGVDADGYPCPKCQVQGPKSKTPTGRIHTETHEPPPPEKTLNQRAFEDGLAGISPVAPADSAYMEWYDEGQRRSAEANAAADVEAGIVDGETVDIPVDDKEPA